MPNSAYVFFNQTDNYLHRSFGVRIRADIVRELINWPVDKDILDAGCGDGGVSLQFLSQNRIVFLDLSENMLALVRNKIPSSLINKTSLVKSSLSEYYADRTFDHVIAIGLLAHVPSLHECLEKLGRFLRPGGTVLVQFSDYDHWITRFNIRRAARSGYNLNKLTRQDMLEAVHRHGLVIKKEVQYSLIFPGMGKLPDSLLYSYSRMISQSKLISRMGSDFIWLLSRP
jgi:ubiquinone/menaquinone biosynthesis C-methylase UbiE